MIREIANARLLVLGLREACRKRTDRIHRRAPINF
jgi:hypothetical protein